MSDKARPGRSKHPATRRYAEAMQELEDVYCRTSFSYVIAP